MNKKRWALLVFCIALIVGYIKLFYKTWNINVVAKNADCIVAIDVKRITNTVIWNIITTPSQWKSGNVFSGSKKKQISWKDMIEVPDYILPFHISGQPANTWFVVLKIKDDNDFNAGLTVYHFEKLNSNEYVSDELGIRFFRNGEQVLVTQQRADTTNYLAVVANELFTEKAYVEKKKLEKAIAAKSHLAVYIAANNFLQEAAVIKANFDKKKIEITSTLIPARKYGFTENIFLYSPNSLFTGGFTQPSSSVYNLLTDSTKNHISKAVGFNIDSLLLPDNKYYALDIESIKSRIDSAITYTYDDDFNKVEKKVVNNIQEPAFNFYASGENAKTFYTYCLHNNKIEQTDSKQFFTGIPFVKSYFDTTIFKGLNITSANYILPKTESKFAGILFLNLSLSKIPADLFKYFPDDATKVLSNIESIQLEANKKDQQLIINFFMQKKKNDLPVIKL